MDDRKPAKTAKRRTRALLATGIFLVPYIFVWFLLRRGHTTQARALGFGWAALCLLVWIAAPQSAPTDAGSKASAEPVEVAAEQPPEEEQVQRIAVRPELSPEAKELKALYDELEGFRRDPEFLRVGFGLCCRFNGWKVRVEELRDTSGAEIFQELRISPGDLLQLGFEYMQNDGNSTQLSQGITARLDYALAPAQPTSGSGRIMEEGWWCRDFDTWVAYMQANERGDYAAADNLRSESACPHVLPNSLTGPELERRYYTMSDGSLRVGFVRVKLRSGPEVWAPLDAIEFR